MKSSAILVLLISALFFGCQTSRSERVKDYVSESHLYARWLPVITDNVTTRMQITEKLGVPSGSFETGRIVTYRIFINEWKSGLSEWRYRGYCTNKYSLYVPQADQRFQEMDKDGAVLVATDDNKIKFEKEIIAALVEFHLILAFDEQHLLKKHSLIRVQP